MANYGNNRTYAVHGIDSEKTPMSTFEKEDGTQISFKEYFEKNYGVEITDKE